jgi:hypothetical protein
MRMKSICHLRVVASGLEEDLVVQLLPQNVILHAPGKLRQTRTDQLLTSGNHCFLATQQILQLKFAWNLVNLFGWKFKIRLHLFGLWISYHRCMYFDARSITLKGLSGR